MTTVATYQQVLDVEIDLQLVGGDTDRTFTESVPVAPVSGEGVVVSWVARRKASGNVTYTVELNGTLLNTYTVTSADKVTVTETTSTSNAVVGDNTLVFTVTGGNGTLGLGDILLWTRVDV